MIPDRVIWCVEGYATPGPARSPAEPARGEQEGSKPTRWSWFGLNLGKRTDTV
ncbi:MAG: hypothetical protein WB765_07400 [Acidimicrobiales bacterium]